MLLPAGRAPQAALAAVAAKGDALALSDGLEELIAEGKDTPADREFALKTIRLHPENTAAYAFARAAVTGRVVQSRGLTAVLTVAPLVSDVEHWAELSRKLDPNFREGAATRALGTLYVLAPSGWLEHGNSEEGLTMLEGLVKAHPHTLENSLRLAEAYISLGDPASGVPYLCRCQARKDALRRDDQLHLEHLFADAGNPHCATPTPLPVHGAGVGAGPAPSTTPAPAPTPTP